MSLTTRCLQPNSEVHMRPQDLVNTYGNGPNIPVHFPDDHSGSVLSFKKHTGKWLVNRMSRVSAKFAHGSTDLHGHFP